MTTRTLSAGLAPVAQALIDAAHAHAAEREAAAAAEVCEREQAAQAAADEVIAQARRDGESVAERAGARMLGEARRRARERSLQAQRFAYDAVRAAIRAEVAQRRETDQVRSLIATMTDRAHAALGPDAVVQALTGDAVGIVADAGNRHLELTLEDLIDRDLADAAERVLGLWQ